MSETGTVYIIDDDEDLRLSLDSLLRSVGLQTEMHSSAAEFMQTAMLATDSCVVLDVRLPGLSGLDFQDYLVKNDVSIPVIMMTGHGDIPMSVRAMKAGAIDFLPKPFRDQDMLDAVFAALRLSSQRQEGDSNRAALHARLESLSPRERQVMTMVTRGLMNKQVAGELNLSEITVKIHRGAAMRKMQARSLAELVQMSQVLKLHET
jgi:FixJ family two-component response regulator